MLRKEDIEEDITEEDIEKSRRLSCYTFFTKRMEVNLIAIKYNKAEAITNL